MPRAVIASPSDQRFRPDRRLHTPRDYAAVFAERRVRRSACFDLLSGPAAVNPRASRLGLVIPKRLARGAVLRNLIKRQARECFRHCMDRLPPADFVLRLSRWTKQMAELAEQSRCRQDLKTAVRKEIGELLAAAGG